MVKTEGTGKKSSRQFPLFSFRVELRDIKPKVWRYFYAPSDISLTRLNDVIQTVMGWTNSHLHSFTIFGQEYFDTDEDDMYSANVISGLSKIKLNKLGLSKGSKFSYLYDMGDSWEHVIKVLDTDYVPKKPGQKFGCTKGARACPPEDCGGVYGYMELLEVLANPKHEEHEEMKEWAGGLIDPEEFDADFIDSMLRHFK